MASSKRMAISVGLAAVLGVASSGLASPNPFALPEQDSGKAGSEAASSAAPAKPAAKKRSARKAATEPFKVEPKKAESKPRKAYATKPRAAAPGSSLPADQPIVLPEARMDLTGPRISLSDALRTTLETSPELRSARLEVQSRRGLLQEASGRFDSAIQATPSFEKRRTSLTESALIGEIGRRTFLRESFDNLSRIADDIAKGLTDDKGRPSPDCGGNQYYINGYNICSDNLLSTDTRTFELLLNTQETLRGTPPSDDGVARLQRAIAEQNRRRLTSVVSLIRRVFLPALGAQLVALGTLPKAEETDTFTLDLRYPFASRDGCVLSPVLYLEGTRNNFIGKPDNPAFGGKGLPTLYRGIVGLSLDVPLARGFGKGSAAAPESAARLNLAAALESLAQTASDRVLQTVIAYWNLAAAQEVYGLQLRSAALQRRALELSEALASADEIARVELFRVKARTADAEAAAAQARRSVVSARVELARAMGLAIEDLDAAPLAAGALPSVDAAKEAARLAEAQLMPVLERVHQNRADVKAAWKRRDASQVLLAAARRDLKPRFDFSLQAGYGGIYEDGRFEVTSAVSPTGFWRSFTGRYVGPSVKVGVKFEIPIGNNFFRGNLVRSQALFEESEIVARNLERTARARAFEAARSVREVGRETASRAEAARYQEESIRASYERFRAGDMPLLDALLTERSLTQSQLSLVSARQTYAARVARLRFEAGTLLPYTISGDDVLFGKPEPTGLK